MTEIYEPPRASLLVPEKPATEMLSDLLKAQRVVVAPFIAFMVTLTGYFLITHGGFSGFVFLLIGPTFIAGLIVKYVCSLIALRYRIIAMLPTLAINILFLSGNVMIAFGVIVLASVAFLAVSKRPLSHEQEQLLYKWKVGRLSP